MPQGGLNGNNVITGCYSCIVNNINVESPENYYEYVQKKGSQLAQKYFTALGRERYGMYRTNNNMSTLKEKFGIEQ